MLHFVCAFFFFASLGLSVTAIVLERWYVITESTVEYNFGVLRFCTAGSCDWINFPLMGTTCTSSGDQENRWYGFQSLSFLGALMALVTLITCISTSVGASRARIAASVFTWLSCGLSSGGFIYLVEYWMFCGAKYCSGKTSCANEWDLSLYFMIGAGGSALFGFIFAIVALIKLPGAEEQEEDEEEEEEEEEGGAGDEEQQGQEEEQQQQQQTDQRGERQRNQSADSEPYGGGDGRQRDLGAADATKQDDEAAAAEHHQAAHADVEDEDEDEDRPPNLPEGDWVYDVESGLYWSEDQYLYMDLESEQFYDPESGMWYNEEVGDWFYADDVEEDE